jgi:hypothetical protein
MMGFALWLFMNLRIYGCFFRSLWTAIKLSSFIRVAFRVFDGYWVVGLFSKLSFMLILVGLVVI